MTLANSRSIPALFFLICQLLLPPSALPLQPAETKPGIEIKEIASPRTEDQGTEGIASYYAQRYNGRETSSGERYDPEKMTAAHCDLPFGTQVRVVNLSNKRQVVVTVNDRCRRKKVPFIDLSRAAARELGFLGKGITKVKISRLE